jgi:hypothetical protein
VHALLWGRVWEVYIKVPPKAGGRWGNLTEKQLNRIPPGGFRFTSRLSRRLDQTQIRLSWTKIRLNRLQIQLSRTKIRLNRAKIRLNHFPKNLHTTFLIGLTGRLAVTEGNSAETG